MSLDAGDIAYLAKLRKSKRDKKLIAAYLLLLYALRRLRANASSTEITAAIVPSTTLLGTGIATYVGRQMQASTDRKPIAAALLAAVALHAAQAVKLEDDDARSQRLGLIARAELQMATAEASRRAADGKRILTRQTTSAAPCSQCEDLAGTYAEPWPDDAFWTHPNCLIAGHTVFGPAIVASVERRYTGPLVRIETASGYFLTCTPNHPVLTPDGWVPAGLLVKGSNVVCASALQGILEAVDPDEYQVPALIEDVARALGGTHDVAARAVPTTAEDFHGDGRTTEVCIVRTNGLLRNADHAPLFQPATQHDFGERDMQRLTLDGQGATAFALERLDLTAASGLGGSGIGTALLTRERVTVQPAGFGNGTRSHPGGKQPTVDSYPAYAVPEPQRLLAFASHVATDQIRDIQVTSDVRTHVFNLQTAQGWYAATSNESTGAMGIVTHNCACEWSDGGDTPA